MAANELAISLENHRARLLTAEMVDRTDVIFVMDYQNQAQILSRHAAAKNKVFMIGSLGDPTNHLSEICDPYYEGLDGTRQCYQTLSACVENLFSASLLNTQT